MAAVSPHRCPAPQAFITVLFVLSAGGPFSSVSCFKVAEGAVASLSCQYSVKRFGLSRVCWGRGCGTFWCNNILVQTDENGVISKVADRYRLTGDVLDGQMDLDILNVRRSDSGPYCCRVDVDGIFNDKKLIMNLRVVRDHIRVRLVSFSALVTTSPPTTTTATTVTEPSASTVSWKTLLSTQLDLVRRNSTLPRSDSVTIRFIKLFLMTLQKLLRNRNTHSNNYEDGGIYSRALKSGCFSSEEPPHIIYEIRMRRPVQENIYILD
ncbi:hypothetical protein F2P81_024781 [Scophthalmus maximus]|uniref:Ig-like domain-containing protein n=1 Tax=Scophthalmus maximus TaxID=52904 RepID=A0A6A4RTT9_SCOMX|nr:hypothetical protein F2P81_024781 [Scophthalmus maximus]